MTAATIAQLLSDASERLSESDSALLDAQVLLASVLEVNRSYFYAWPDKVIAPEPIERFLSLVQRRELGEPVAYLVGKQEFWSLELNVSAATLIPRPETELLVELVLEKITAPGAIGIDLGTGTGAIALALASEQPQWQLLGIDFCEQAVALANLNKQHLSITNVDFSPSSWLKNVESKYRLACDFIVSNPPYIDSEDPHLSQGDVRYEPVTALVAANNGYQDMIDIAKQGGDFLKPDGLLLFEHGFEQGAQVRAILSEFGYVSIITIPDLAGLDRVTLGYKAS